MGYTVGTQSQPDVRCVPCPASARALPAAPRARPPFGREHHGHQPAPHHGACLGAVAREHGQDLGRGVAVGAEAGPGGAHAACRWGRVWLKGPSGGTAGRSIQQRRGSWADVMHAHQAWCARVRADVKLVPVPTHADMHTFTHERTLTRKHAHTQAPTHAPTRAPAPHLPPDVPRGVGDEPKLGARLVPPLVRSVCAEHHEQGLSTAAVEEGAGGTRGRRRGGVCPCTWRGGAPRGHSATAPWPPQPCSPAAPPARPAHPLAPAFHHPRPSPRSPRPHQCEARELERLHGHQGQRRQQCGQPLERVQRMVRGDSCGSRRGGGERGAVQGFRE